MNKVIEFIPYLIFILIIIIWLKYSIQLGVMTLAVLMSITVAVVSSATAGSAERNGSEGNEKTIVDYHTILHDVIFVSHIKDH
jgi:hypothetical protein